MSDFIHQDVIATKQLQEHLMPPPTAEHPLLGKQISVVFLSNIHMAWDIAHEETNGKFTTSQSLMNSSLVIVYSPVVIILLKLLTA